MAAERRSSAPRRVTRILSSRQKPLTSNKSASLWLLVGRRSRARDWRHERNYTKGRMIKVGTLVKAYATAFIQREGRALRCAEAGGRIGWRISERHTQMQKLPAFEHDRTRHFGYINAKALQREACAGSPCARGLRPSHMRKGCISGACAQLLFDVHKLELRLGQHFQEAADLPRLTGGGLIGAAVVTEITRARFRRDRK